MNRYTGTLSQLLTRGWALYWLLHSFSKVGRGPLAGFENSNEIQKLMEFPA